LNTSIKFIFKVQKIHFDDKNTKKTQLFNVNVLDIVSFIIITGKQKSRLVLNPEFLLSNHLTQRFLCLAVYPKLNDDSFVTAFTILSTDTLWQGHFSPTKGVFLNSSIWLMLRC